MKIKRSFRYIIPFLFIVFYVSKLIVPEEPINQSPIEFDDFTEKAGIDAVIPGAKFSWGDFDNDGDQDLLIGEQGLYKNTGPTNNWKFENIIIDDSNKGNYSGAWGDYDNDGFIDIINTKGVLLRNNKGQRFDVKKELWTSGRTAVSWGDYDNDGFIDIYATPNDEDVENGHTLLRNCKGIKFEKAPVNKKIEESQVRSKSVVWCDYNNDGYQEIYVGNYDLAANFLWKFDGYGSVEDIAITVNCAGNNKHSYYGNTQGAAWADFNNDGLFDLWVANLAHKDNFEQTGMRSNKCDDSHIYINKGPPNYEFTDIRNKSNIPKKPSIGIEDIRLGATIEDELWYNVACADFDNDGYIDIFIAQTYDNNYERSLLFRNLGNLEFEEVRANIKLIANSGGVALADFNNDGFIDIVTSGYEIGDVGKRKKVYLYRNKGNSRSWIEFQLIGSKSNRSAIGTIVKIKTKDSVQIRQVEGSSGSHGQQNSMILHFGLNDIEEVDEAEIIWPSGKKQKCKDLLARKIHTIYENHDKD